MPSKVSEPVVTCPGCALAMKLVSADHHDNGVNLVTFRCERCGTETTRMIKGEHDVTHQGRA